MLRSATLFMVAAGLVYGHGSHTDADLDVGGLRVPKGDYTLYCWAKNPDAWESSTRKLVKLQPGMGEPHCVGAHHGEVI
jgi:hypothetical protein